MSSYFVGEATIIWPYSANPHPKCGAFLRRRPGDEHCWSRFFFHVGRNLSHRMNFIVLAKDVVISCGVILAPPVHLPSMGCNWVFTFSTRGVSAAHCLAWAFGRHLSLLPVKKACQPVPCVFSPPWHLQAWRRCNGPRSVGTCFPCLATSGSSSFTPRKASPGVGRWIFLTPPAVLDTSASPVESQRICGHLYKCSFRRHWPSGWLAIRLVSTLERDAMGDTNMLSSRTSQCEKKIWAHGVGVQGLKMSIFLQCGPRYQPAGDLLGCSNKTKQTS